MNKQLFEKQANQYNPFFPIVRLEDIIETISDKSIQWILNNYNHIYVEYSESKAITRNKVPSLLRRKGLWITYNANNELITEYFKGDNKDVTNYIDWTHDENWERFDKLSFVDGSITYQHLSEAVKQLLGSGNTITNYPDDEDLTVKDNTLKLKDRDYDVANFSGLGRIILRKNIIIADKKVKNVLTQDMINKENTIYEIRYDFDLNGGEITVPEGCTLDFQGGGFSNGSIIGNGTNVKAGLVKIFNLDINISGNWNVSEVYPEWFGAKGDGTTDDSNAINKLSGFVVSMYHYPIIKLLNNKVYAVANTVITDCWIDFNGSKLLAISQMSSLLKINIQIRGKNPNISFSIPDGIKIFNGIVDGNGLADICVQTTGIGTIFISNLSIKNPITYGICANTPMQLIQSPMVYMENCRILIEEDKIDLSKTTYAIHTNFNDSYFNAVEIRDFTYGIFDYGGNNRFINIHHWMYRGNVSKSTFARTNNDSIYENCVIDTVRYGFSIYNSEKLSIRGCNVFTNTDAWRHSIAEGSTSDNVFLFLFNNKSCYAKAYDLYVHTPVQVIVSNLEVNEIDHLFLDNPDIKGKEIKSAYYILSNYRSQRYINTAISDLNSLVQEGVYSMIGNAKNLKNKPNGLNNVDLISVEIIRTSNITLKQVAYYPTSDLGYDTYIRKATYGNNTWTFTSWGRYRGEVDVVYSGDSTKRPTLSNASIGFRYFDTTINKPIYWTGTKWVDATGADV